MQQQQNAVQQHGGAATAASSASCLPPSSATMCRHTATTLETELRNLCAEARRKYPDLQSSAERAIVKLRAIAQMSDAQQQQQQHGLASAAAARTPVDILQSESVIRPFLVACGSKNPRLATMSLSSLQRLLTLVPLNGRFISTLVGCLRVQAESEDGSVQLKVLQTLLLTLSPAGLECGELLRGSLLQCLGVCFRLVIQRRNEVVHHTAGAAVRQVVSRLYEKVTSQCNEGTLWMGGRSKQEQQSSTNIDAAADADASSSPHPSSSSSSSFPSQSSLLPSPLDTLSLEGQNAFLLFDDLCTLALASSAASSGMLSMLGPGSDGSSHTTAATASGTPSHSSMSSFRPRWLTSLSPSALSVELCLELLESIVGSHVSLFERDSEFFERLIRSRLCDIIWRLMKVHTELSVILRCIRIVVVLVRNFHSKLLNEIEIFMSIFLRMLDRGASPPPSSSLTTAAGGTGTVSSATFPLWNRILILEALLQLLKSNQERLGYWMYVTYDLPPPALHSPAPSQTGKNADASISPATNTDATSPSTSTPSSSPSPSSRQRQQHMKVYTSLIHALTRLIMQTSAALVDAAGNSATASSTLPNIGLSSSATLISHGSVTPSLPVTVPTSPTSPTSSLSNSVVSEGGAKFDYPSGAATTAAAGGGGGGSATLNIPASVGSLHWKLYTSKGSKGLDLLHLEQEGSLTSAAAAASGSQTMSSAAGSTSGGGSGGAAISGSTQLHDESYVVTLSVECMVTLINSIATLAKTNEQWFGTPTCSLEADELSTQPNSDSSTPLVSSPLDCSSLTPTSAHLKSMCTATSHPLLSAFSFLLHLSAASDESAIQHLLMSYQSFTTTCGVLGLANERDAFIENLTSFALPHVNLAGAHIRDLTCDEIVERVLGGSGGAGSVSGSTSGASSGTGGSGGRDGGASTTTGPSLSSIAHSSPEVRQHFLRSLMPLLLSPKHIQSFKALFNIIHCLGNFLGSTSWLTVLETFQTLDTLIQFTHALQYRLSREGGNAFQTWLHSNLVPHQTEISILSAALSRLFESTRFLDDQAVTHVLSALGTLSLASLANAATSDGLDHPHMRSSSSTSSSLPGFSSTVGTTLPGSLASFPSSVGVGAPPSPPGLRLFALANLVAVLEHNLFRITSPKARLWEIGVGHLTCVVNHREANMRRYGVAALTKVTILALTKPSTYQRPTDPSAHATSPSPDQGDEDGGSVLSRKRHSRASLSSLSALPLSSHAFRSAIQSLLLEPWSDLCRSKYDETREQILQSVFTILQNAGQVLCRGGWKVVLGVLKTVVKGAATAMPMPPTDAADINKDSSSPTNSAPGSSPSKPSPSPPPSSTSSSSVPVSSSLVSLGFSSIQLLTNDFLEQVHAACLSQLIDVIALYCRQDVETNISFTSIGLLWRVSDYLASKTLAESRAETAAQSQSTSTSRTEVDESEGEEDYEDAGNDDEDSDVDIVRITPRIADRLMRLLFAHLVNLSVDARTEVRNSAVKTLHNTLVAHAARMSSASCASTLRSLVLPLLRRLLTDRSLESLAGGTNLLASTELGKDRTTGKSVMMLVHYSRDSSAKQWDETRVYAMQGTARVIKCYMENWNRSMAATSAAAAHATSPSDTNDLSKEFLSLWLEFLDLAQASLRHRSPEVNLTGLNSVCEIGINLVSALSSSASSSIAHLLPLWPPLFDRFYIPVVLHGLLQHRHLEWLENEEEAAKKRKKQQQQQQSTGGSDSASPSTASSPFMTELGNISSDDGWKNWNKTYSQLLSNFHTIITHTFNHPIPYTHDATNPPRDDCNLILHLSHILVRAHSRYTDRKAQELFNRRWAQAMQSQARSQISNHTAVDKEQQQRPDVAFVDKKETPMQAAHLKLFDALAPTPTQLSQQGAPTQSSLSSPLWRTVFRQLLTYLSAEYTASDEQRDVEAELDAVMHGDDATLTIGDKNQNRTPLSPASKQQSAESTSSGPVGDVSAAAPPLPFSSTSFIKKLLRLLDRFYSPSSPPNVRSAQFAPVLAVLHEVIERAATATGSRSSSNDETYTQLCEEAVAALIHVLERGINSLRDDEEEKCATAEATSRPQHDHRVVESVWNTLLQIFASFLAPPDALHAFSCSGDELRADETNANANSASFPFDQSRPFLLPVRSPHSPPQSRLWENLQIALVGCLVRVVLPQVARVPNPGRVTKLLVALFNIGYTEEEHARGMNGATVPAQSIAAHMQPDANGAVSIASADNELLSHSCLMGLFQLAREGVDTQGNEDNGSSSTSASRSLVCSIALPLLHSRCRHILNSYLSLERVHPPSQPLPRSRREEVACVLRQLANMQQQQQQNKETNAMQSNGSHQQQTNGEQTQQGANKNAMQHSTTKQRSLLLQLFPILCECVIMRDGELRELLRDVFVLASKELGLTQS